MRFKRKRPPSRRKRTKKDYLEDFYSVLALNHYNSEQKANIFIELDSLLVFVTQYILDDCVERRDYMTQEAAEVLSIFDTCRKPELISWRKSGHSTVTVLKNPIQSFVCLSRTSLLDTRRGREKLRQSLFCRNSQSTNKFNPGNLSFFIWWDTTSARGYFLLPPKNLPDLNLDFEDLGAVHGIIIMCPLRTLQEPKTIQFIMDKTGFTYVSDSRISVGKFVNFGTHLDLEHADLFCRFLITQKASKFRKLFLQMLNPILCENAIWNLAFTNNAQARENTINQYMVHIIGFSYFQNTTVKQTFLQMRNQSVNDLLLARYLRQRIGQVKIDTVLQAVNSFVWFYRRFLRVKVIPFHSQTFAEIKNLQKRLREEPEGSEPLDWCTMQKFLYEIKNFEWKKFQADDIFDVALISLWGALRISESCDISHETTSICPIEDLLKIKCWDAKSATGNKPQWKFVSAFPSRPEFCPLEAFTRLKNKSSGGVLVRNSAGKPLTPGRLSPMFNKFVNHCRKINLLDEVIVITWHVFRVSYMNISFEEFGIPIRYSQATGCHRAIESTHGYIKRTQFKRRRTAAKLFASQAEQNFNKDEMSLQFLLKALTTAPTD